MKKILLIASLIVLISSCAKDNVTTPSNIYGASVNKDIFFSVTFNGKTLKANGLTFSVLQYVDMLLDFMFVHIITHTVSGQTQSELNLFVDPIYTSIFNLSNGEVSAAMSLERIGDAVGRYTFVDYMPNYINDYTVGNKEYKIDIATSNLTVTSVDAKFIKGTFSCNLIDGTKKIPATGSFTLPKF